MNKPVKLRGGLDVECKGKDKKYLYLNPIYDCTTSKLSFEAWLKQHMLCMEDYGHIHTCPVRLDYDEAMFLLNNNGANRKPTRSNVERLLMDMEDGKWLEGTDPLAIGKPEWNADHSVFEILLLNGQNRMIALTAHKKPLWFQLAINVDRVESRSMMDQCRKRTPDQILELAESPLVASAMHAFYCAPDVDKFPPTTVTERVELADLMREDAEKLIEGIRSFKGHGLIIRQASILAAMLRAQPYVEFDTLLAFAKIYCDGAAADISHAYERAPLLLRQAVTEEPDKGSASSRVHYYRWATVALNAYHLHRVLKKVRGHKLIDYPLTKNIQRFKREWDKKRDSVGPMSLVAMNDAFIAAEAAKARRNAVEEVDDF